MKPRCKQAAVILSVFFTAAYGQKDEDCTKVSEAICKNDLDTTTNCLQRQFDSITDKACKEKLAAARKDWLKKDSSFRTVKAACSNDVSSLCPDSLSSGKDFKVCLMMNPDKLSTDCKSAANTHIKEYLPGFNQIP